MHGVALQLLHPVDNSTLQLLHQCRFSDRLVSDLVPEAPLPCSRLVIHCACLGTILGRLGAMLLRLCVYFECNVVILSRFPRIVVSQALSAKKKK